MEGKKRTEIAEIGKFGLIERICSRVEPQNASTVKGCGDDTAVIDAGDRYVLLSTELLLEGVHFDLTYYPLQHLGYKAVVAGISDILAMNGTPRQIELALGIPARFSVEMIDRLYDGIRAACDRYRTDLAGGDTTASVNGLAIGVTAAGDVAKDRIAYRSGAKPNDLICLSGDLGAAYMGLHLLEREKRACGGQPDPKPTFEGHEYILGRQLKPEARTDIIERLAEAGIEEGKNLTVIYQNAQADMGITQQIAAQFAAKPVDLMVGIATPMAQACYNAAAGAIPTIYTAVSDPVAAGFADAEGKAAGNATGTSDALPVAAQLEMIRALMPEAKAIGILYTTSEVNSLSTIETYKALAGEYGFEIVESGVSTSADIPLALDALLPKVDCLTNLTDNTVVNALALVLDKANAAGKPVYGSEIEQVKLGCAAAEGLDYVALGRQTGLMAARVLKGEAAASDIPYEIITEPSLYVNSKVLESFGITLPEELAARATEAE